MNDLENNHPLHGALFGIGTAVVGKALGLENTQALVAGAAVGGGTYLYMSTYGHTLPWDAATLGESSIGENKTTLPSVSAAAQKPQPTAPPPPAAIPHGLPPGLTNILRRAAAFAAANKPVEATKVTAELTKEVTSGVSIASTVPIQVAKAAAAAKTVGGELSGIPSRAPHYGFFGGY